MRMIPCALLCLLIFIAGINLGFIIVYIKNKDNPPSRTVTIYAPPGLIGPITKGIQNG